MSERAGDDHLGAPRFCEFSNAFDGAIWIVRTGDDDARKRQDFVGNGRECFEEFGVRAWGFYIGGCD